MNDRPFINKSIKPDDKAIQSALKKTYSYYKKIMLLAESYSHEWSFSKSSGWMLKIYNKNKALFYFIPLTDSFKISMAIRENEREAFLNDSELEALQDRIFSAKKYSEGYALQFDISNKKDFHPLELLIIKLIALRG